MDGLRTLSKGRGAGKNSVAMNTGEAFLTTNRKPGRLF